MEQTTTVRVSVRLHQQAGRIAASLDIPVAEVFRLAAARGLALIADEEARRLVGTAALEAQRAQHAPGAP